jgi:hypothetical protein
MGHFIYIIININTIVNNRWYFIHIFLFFMGMCVCMVCKKMKCFFFYICIA